MNSWSNILDPSHFLSTIARGQMLPSPQKTFRISKEKTARAGKTGRRKKANAISTRFGTQRLDTPCPKKIKALFEAVPIIGLEDSMDRQVADAQRGLEDFSRLVGRDFSYVDTAAANLGQRIAQTDDSFLIDTFEKLKKDGLVKIRLLPSVEDAAEFLEDRDKPISFESYIEISDKVFNSKKFKNIDLLRFIATAAHKTGVQQFLLPRYSTKFTNTDESTNLLVNGGFTVLKFLDEKQNKFTLYDFMSSRTKLKERTEFYCNYSKVGVEVSINGNDDYRLVGEFPSKDDIDGWSAKEVKELYDSLKTLVGGREDRIMGIEAPRLDEERGLSMVDITIATPQEIFKDYLNPAIPYELREKIYHATWFWDPSNPDGPRLILNGSGIDAVGDRKEISNTVRENLMHPGIIVEDFNPRDESHQRAKEGSQNRLQLRVVN